MEELGYFYVEILSDVVKFQNFVPTKQNKVKKKVISIHVLDTYIYITFYLFGSFYAGYYYIIKRQAWQLISYI